MKRSPVTGVDTAAVAEWFGDFHGLHARDVYIVTMRFGLKPYDREHNMEEIGEKHSLGTERVGQIIRRAVFKTWKHKMRNGS